MMRSIVAIERSQFIMDGIIYAGGAFRPAADAAVSVFDHGLLYGDGVFEGIRAYNGRVFRLERHIERLFESARAIRLEVPATREEVETLVVETCRRNHIVDGYIRLIVTRGAGDLGLDPRACPRPNIVVIARAGVTLYKRKPTEGITAITSSFRRNAADATSPAIKSLNYLNNVLARIEASDRGADEAILLDRDGHVTEATADNVFIVTERALVTPPTSTTLRGITRETILRLAEGLGIRTDEKPFALFDLWVAREAFMCGTMAEVVPIASVDGRMIGTGTPGPTTLRLMAAYGELVRGTGTPILGDAIAHAGVAASYRV
jgi:branched-chain amino acid aminotransferase